MERVQSICIYGDAMKYSVITPVSTEPITTTEAKLHIRMTSGETAEDNELVIFISAAREYCEGVTGRALATQTLELYLDRFPYGEIELPKAPLQSVTSVKYKDSAGVETTMTANTDYIVDTESEIGRIVLPYGLLWPSFTAYTVNPIKIRFVAGYEATNPIPKSIKQAMLLLIGHWYANREAVGTVGGEIEFAVKALLSMYRIRWW